MFLASTVVRVFRKLMNRSDTMYAQVCKKNLTQAPAEITTSCFLHSWYSRRITEQHSLEPILCTLEDTAENYNILQSAVMELLETIVSNFMRDIGMGLWEEYSEKLGIG